MDRKIRFAVVGCGHIGLRHAEMIHLKPETDLNIEKYKARYFEDLDALLDSDLEIDVINIATPNGLHAEMSLKILKSGRHVVVEKPLALTKSDAEKVIYTALHHGKQVFGVMQNRYSPPSVWIKNLISEGRLGRINMVQINCYWNRDSRYYTAGNWHGNKDLDGGTLFTQFSHFIDVMYWLFGDIENIQSRMVDFNHKESTDFEDSGIVSFDFTNGGMGVINFSTSCWDKNFESSLTILGENGTIKIGGQYMNEVEYCHVKDYDMPVLPPSNPPNDYGAYKGSAANHTFVIQNVIDVIKNQAAITTNALEGLKVVEMIERIYKSV
jgi:predicted dehydrogenase